MKTIYPKNPFAVEIGQSTNIGRSVFLGGRGIYFLFSFFDYESCDFICCDFSILFSFRLAECNVRPIYIYIYNTCPYA